MGEEDLLQLEEPHVAPQELPLRPLRAVEQDPLAAAADQRGGRSPLCRRRRPGRPEEDDVEVHGGGFYGPAAELPQTPLDLCR